MNTMQQEFDAVVAHLYKQGRPAKNASGNCAYRGADGTSCAVGCRIPDSMYDPAMDRTGFSGMAVRSVVQQFKVPTELGEYLDMFDDLQHVHDNTALDAEGNFALDSLYFEMAAVARAHSVNFVVPSKVMVPA